MDDGWMRHACRVGIVVSITTDHCSSVLTFGLTFWNANFSYFGLSRLASSDEMIQQRRQEQKKEIKKGPKKPSAADRSVATSKAKRDAANKARRGLAQDSRPSKMDIEKEVKRQSQATQVQKKKNEQKQTQGRIAPDSTGRSAAKRAKKKSADPPAAVFGGRVPPKKAIEAAIKGMEDSGFKIPAGHQMVMTFVPIVVAPAPGAAPPTQKKQDAGRGYNNNNSNNNSNNKNNNNPNNNNNNNNPNNNKGGGGAGGGGAGRRGGAGGKKKN
jgi:hypothetical protein